MGKYYFSILQLLIARGFAPPRAPVKLGKASKIAILLQYAIV
jgi:phytoene synthase